jgi:hypothetical protein
MVVPQATEIIVKKVMIVGLFLAASSIATASAFAGEYVHGYYRSNGTYVAPHHRSSPDETVTNNYSFEGNINPYTGTAGHDYYRHSPSSP